MSQSDPIAVEGAGKTVLFEPNFPLDKVTGAPYNPRRLSEDSFIRLQASLKKWGVVKPVIVNGDGTLVAGHQRTKALKAIGATHVAAMVMPTKVRMQDEIQFNLLHNRVETEASMVQVPPGDIGEWSFVDHKDIVVNQREAASFRKAIAKLVGQHGPWGSVVCDDQGRVVLNAEYAVVAADQRFPLLVYTIGTADAHDLYTDLTGEYGVYDWTNIDAPVYNQHVVQPLRLREKKSGTKTGQKVHMKSTTWEKHVLPWLTDSHRVMDFGSGYGDYAKMLRGKGFDVHDYEPFRCVDGSYAIDIKTVVSDVQKFGRKVEKDGLFDVVVLDSVINATTSLEYQEAVLTMCSAMMRKDGVLALGTRTLHAELKQEAAGRTSSMSVGVSFLDENNVELNFHKGKWQTLRFHTAETLTVVLEQFFDDIVIKNPTQGNMHAICRLPKPLDPERVEWAANIELNMPYPNEFRHNRHERAVSQLVAAYRKDRGL